MSKRNKRSSKEKGRQPQQGLDPRRQGMRAFQSGRYGDAIALWEDLSPDDPEVAAALAEAYARRARTQSSDPLADIGRAVSLAPNELRYRYQLGLARHRAGDLPAAIECYRAVLAEDPKFPGAPLVLALAMLEQDPDTDLASVPGGTAAVRRTLAPVRALLRATPFVPEGDSVIDRFWHGLSLLQQGDPGARAALDDGRSLPVAAATATRLLYRGVAAARAGDLRAALDTWERAYHEQERQGVVRPWLRGNLAAAAVRYLGMEHPDEELHEAADAALRTSHLPIRSAALGEAQVRVLDRAARAAAGGGDWGRAAELWRAAREVVSATPGLGSPRPLLHNLALAHEAREDWGEAAEAWRAMLRTRPRRTDAQPSGGPTPEQWGWVRRRVIECYKRAGRPGEAVVVFRQAIKADPSDLAMRMQLAEALLANEQEQAAINELHRVLEADPSHVEARLRLAAVHSALGEWWMAEGQLRELMERESGREDVRRQLARLLLQKGRQHHQSGRKAAAAAAYQEGWELAADSWEFPLNLARLAVEERKLDRARELLDRVMELGAEQPEAYTAAIECWAVAKERDEVRATLERAEAALSPGADFYVEVGALLLEIGKPQDPLGLFGVRLRDEPEANPWADLATEVLDRAVGRSPDEGQVSLLIATELLAADEGLALRYAERGAELMPDEPRALMILGMLQALNERKRDAKKTLQRAARVAREQGDAELARDVEDLRSQVDSPMFRYMLRMSSVFGDVDPGVLDLEDLF